jgi:hypothetical protein
MSKYLLSSRLLRQGAAVSLLVFPLFLAGCGERGHAMPKVADEAAAVAALKTTLDKWKAGATADSLGKETPAIHAVDEDWEAGNKLLSYEVQPPLPASGISARIPAVLEIQSSAGVQRKTVQYLVETDPRLSVVREFE